MKYNGKVIKGFKVVNRSNNDEVIAEICDDHMETTNGYEVIIINKFCNEQD